MISPIQLPPNTSAPFRLLGLEIRWLSILLAALIFSNAGIANADERVTQQSDGEALFGMFKRNCTQCHGDDGVTEGDVDLASVQSPDDLLENAELLQDLLRVLQDREMPPADETPLAEPERDAAVSAVKRMLPDALRRVPFKSTPIRRMNRFQYNNAVVDLLELDRDIFQLNERLMRRREDYFDPAARKMPDRVQVSCRPLSKDIDNQRPEGFRGVAAFPQDQRAEHGFDNRADHLSLSPLLMESFLQLSQSIASSPDLNPDECRCWDRLFATPGQSVRVPIDGKYEAEQSRHVQIVGSPGTKPNRQVLRLEGEKWSKDAHLFWRNREADGRLELTFETDRPAKGLRLQFTKAPDYGRFMVLLNDRTIIDSVDLYDTTITTTTVDLQELSLPPGKLKLTFVCAGKNEDSTKHYFGLDYVELIDVEPAKAPDDADHSREIRNRLSWLLRRAFRHPVENETLDRFATFADEQLAAGESYEATMRTIVGAVIGMPEFLYLNESSAVVTKTAEGSSNDQPRNLVDDFELASRLSQFLWSSIPDDQLLELAEAGQLSRLEVLAKQIDRMMDDPRSGRFCENFPGQWLQLDRLVTAIPDQAKYPYFYYHGYRTSMHMMSEPLLLFETIFVEDRSVMELLDPDFTWQSKMLKANYEGRADGSTEVQVQTFERVPLDDPRRGGVITNAAVMTMTSTPTRTQPITRGAWVNAVIFNDPPEPPPADVPPLPESNAEELEKMTIRERLAAHRQRADCAGCHNKIDPLGFVLENYGPTGVWRDQYENGREVDVAGELFNQHKFTSLVEFKQLLLDEKPRFIRAFAAHLLSYALGRELGPADTLAIDEIALSAESGNDTMRAILKLVAMSEPFRHK